MADPIRQELGPDGIAVWWFDLPGEKVNTLGRATMERLSALIDEAGRCGDIRAVLVTSAKDGNFIAGADIEEIRAGLSGADAGTRAREASAQGQEIYARLEALLKPTMAVINGTCMGGGTELALACRYRMASDDPRVRISLPEVKLGIVPAWGGCTRLPRLVGLQGALAVILAGKELKPKQALKMGLVDEVVPPQAPVATARGLLQGILKEGDARVLARRAAARPFLAKLLEGNPLGRSFIYSKALEGVRAETRGQYPAPERALGAIKAGLERGRESGFQAERDAIGELAGSPIARHLIGIFFMMQDNKRYTGGAPSGGAKPREVARLGVLGAGLMGSGIAQVAAGKGLHVRMKDVNAAALGRGMAAIAADQRKRVKRHAMTELEFSAFMGRVAPTSRWDGFRGVDFVIEAVLEKLELKRQVLAEFRAVNPDGIFASNTSTLPIASIAEGSPKPELVIGMHFFSPVPRMPLVEVIPGARTAPEVTATTLALARRLGKVVFVAKDSPGFLVNRILAPYLNEAFLCLEEGASMTLIDDAMLHFGMPVGPIALVQQVGLGVAQHAGKVMLSAFGDRLQGSGLMERLAADKPFYLGKGKERRPNPEVEGALGAFRRERGIAARADWTEAELQERLVMAQVNEAAFAMAEGVVRTPEEVDLAMIFGTGFAPFRGGLLRHADAVGAKVCAEAVERLHAKLGRRFTPAPYLLELARAGKGFYA